MRALRWALAGLVALVAIAAAWVTYTLNDRPSLARYADRRLPPAAGGAGLRVTFLGVSTLLIDDGDTAIMTDGFFTRPGFLRTLASTIAPDADAIGAALERAGAGRLAAVVVVHSHYDHAMDAPEVARRTGALLVGSESTANVGRGWNLPNERILVVRGGETLDFGRFRVTMVPSRHFPHGMAMGEITAPLRPPARVNDYLEGGSFSVLVEYGGRAMLVQGSAGYVEGALRGRQADVVFLGVAGLGLRDAAYRDAYWREIVTAVGARRVVPIHWDDFTRPLSEPLVPLPRLLDDFDATMDFLLARAAASGVDLQFADARQRVDPFAGL